MFDFEKISELSFRELLSLIYKALQFPLLKLGNTKISIASILVVVFSVILLIYLSGKFKRFLQNRLLKRYEMDAGIRQSMATYIRYLIITIGGIIIIQSAGIDLSTLGILAGALGVGIGFGLQNITNNFISGIIILFERPVRVGDRIEVGEIKGNVVRIAARATTILTNDNITLIVPNSEFINSNVINWSHGDPRVRFRYDVGVSYKEDPERVKQILLEVAAETEGVLKNPAPDVLFDQFADSSINFKLRVWTNDFATRPNVLKSHLYYAISKKFKEHKVEIPFPQRDLHLKSGFANPEKKEPQTH